MTTVRAAHVIVDQDEALAVAAEQAAEIAIAASERDRDRRLPHAEIEQLSASGLLAISVPREFGGAEVNATTLAQVLAVISAADSSVGQIPQSHFVFLDAIWRVGTQQQKAFFAAEVLAGARLGNAQAEPARGGTRELHTTIVQGDDGDFTVDGTKLYCTGALFAHWIPAVAKGTDGKQYIAYIPVGETGLQIIDDWSGMGQRTTASGTVHLVGVRVPADRVVAHHTIFDRAQTFGARAQLLHAAIETGLARGALTEAIAQVRKASHAWFESGVDRASEEPLLIQRFGELEIRVRAAEALLREAGRAIDEAGQNPSDEAAGAASIAVAAAKAFADGAALESTSALLEVVGSRGSLEAQNLNRYWRNARTHTLHDPVRWKIQHVGRYALNGTLPPRHGTI
jgi:SfnB family sulfur acquisition oxidoreductase